MSEAKTLPERIEQDYPMIAVRRLSGDEFFQDQNGRKDFTVADFWQWFGSDLSNNVIRGALAEFIVASALEIADSVRDIWSPFDLLWKEKIKIEVKSAAYLQSWYQKKLSAISFDIKQSVAYDAATNEFDKEAKRQADFYIFCLLHFQEKANLNPLDLNQWEFFILSTDALNAKHLNQSRLSLSSLLKLNPIRATYEEIADCFEKLT